MSTVAAAATVIDPVHIISAVIGAVYVAPTRVEDQRVKIKRTIYIVYKYTLTEERWGIK